MTKYALITGGSSGIGYALAHEFALNGYNLVIVADKEDKLKAAAEILSSAHDIKIVLLAKDLTKESSAREIYDELISQGIKPEVLVNDAGVGQRGMFHETILEEHIHIIRLNIESLTRLTHLFLNDMIKRDSGKILNLGSIAGFQPGPTLAVYHATKAYVVSLSEALAEELKDTNVTVTCLCPGPTATHFFDRADMEDTNIVEKGQLMDPADVAHQGYEALMRGERVFIPGAVNKILTFTRRLIPQELQAKIHKKMYEESEE